MSDSQEHVELGKRRQPAFAFIFVTAVMDVLALGVMIPVLPNLVKVLAGGDYATASLWNALFGATWGFMQFVCSPIIGMMSDRFGRRPVLLTSIFGLGVDFLFMAFAPNIRWLFVGRVINGATAASFSTSQAYVADVTAPENRAKAFGLMGAAFGIGFTFGPALGGYLAGFDIRLPFLVCAGIALTNWLYGFFILPESLPPERCATRFEWKRANPVGSLKLLRSHPDLLGLATVGFLFNLAHVVLPAIFVLYTGHRYGWTPAFMGLTMMGTGIASIVVQTTLIGPVVKRIGERGALLLGLSMGCFGFLIYALAPTTQTYLMGIPVFALMGFTGPGMQGLMTRRVSPREQGRLQGANAAIAGITGILGPPLFNLTFAWSVRNEGALNLPGLAVLLASGLMALAFVIALGVAKPAPAAEPQAV
jgi:DHA1 family tetracycline resistance protein-like MFS transporter